MNPFDAHFSLRQVTPNESRGMCPSAECMRDAKNDDRFRAVRLSVGWRGFCRRCSCKGDLAQWLIYAGRARDFADAKRILGVGAVTVSSLPCSPPPLAAAVESKAPGRADCLHLAKSMHASMTASAVAYLESRGIWDDVASDALVGVTASGRLSLPWLARVDDAGSVSCERIQTRSLTGAGDRYRIMPHGTSVLPWGYGMGCWRSAWACIVCEGEIDALAMQTALRIIHGLPGVCVVTRGSAAITWTSDDFPPLAELVIDAHDADDAGDDAAKRLQTVTTSMGIGYARMRPVTDIAALSVAERAVLLTSVTAVTH